MAPRRCLTPWTWPLGSPSAGLTEGVAWADKAGCSRQVSEERIDPAAPKWAIKRTRSGCVGGTSSVQYVMHGAGHVIPGLAVRSPLIRHFIGDPTMTLDGGTVIWNFFRSTLGR